ncbi:Oligosaccharyl transferase STT3 subunit [Pyrolobus fumarii 1A]|uniref:dolichyl-phosphooligosaccharide-protein glycotransferase n=1 Tax=Pyrolobus fumarii (strain DSM 11204 / 1A) TaxID=694429 RepID=G0EHN2_PYRF1|nr:STT3 domain-containing protein [Pyrolobus fumarii]AEM39385.1 Oligosaccharyl transferase STT3 subunit [Pyrolobus fumarii 1A]
MAVRQIFRAMDKFGERLASGKLRLVLYTSILVLSVILAVMLRGLAWPVWVKYGVYIDAFDPWIEYWTAKYLYTHGLSSWWDLRPPNPDVMKFWYPWGRDFTRSSYPLVPMLIASTYPLVSWMLSFEQWAAWVPPLAGAALVIVVSWLLYRRYGLLAGVTGALLTAMLPASLDRTLLGFIEKEGVVLPLVILSVYLMSRSLDNLDNPVKRRVYAFAAGLAGALVGLGWGGYLLPVFVAALSVVLLPAAGIRVKREYIDIPILYWVGLLPAMLFSRWRGIGAMIGMPGGVLLAAAAGVIVLAYLYDMVEKRRTRFTNVLRTVLNSPVRYTLATVSLLTIVFIVGVFTGIMPARSAFLLLPGALKTVIVEQRGPLVESIAEHAADPVKAINEATLMAVLFALLGIIYLAYRVLMRGVAGDIPVLVATSVGYYAMFNAAYFLQTGGVFTALAAAALLGVASEYLTPGAQRGRRRVHTVESQSVVRVLAVVVAVLLVLNAGISVALKSPLYATRLPLVLTSGVSTTAYIPSWYMFLKYINTSTPSDTVVVSWWDYGYWLSVVGDRASLADGATMNATQISLLARILVGDYHEAVKLLEKLKCRPNRTLIVAYGLYQLVRQGDRVVAMLLPTAGDLPKSYWMIRIGGLPLNEYIGDIPVNVGGNTVTVRTFNVYSEAFQNALLYRLLFQAPLMLNEENVVKFVDKRIESIVDGAEIVPALAIPLRGNQVAIVELQGSATRLLAVPEGFRHAVVSAYPLMASGNTVVAVIVAAFEWTG